MKSRQFWKIHNNLRPLQVYKLNDFEAFTVGKINLLEEKVYGNIIPLEFVGEPFVEITRFETLDLSTFNLKLIKDFKGFWNGRYWQ
jgi:hypothetical protein